MNKNHEGYHDPTACEAIRRANRRTRICNRTARMWKPRKEKTVHLTYLLSEAHGFTEAVRLLRE